MNKFAVIGTGGKQYKVAAGDILKVERLEGNPGDKITLDKVLLVAIGDKVEVGMPYLTGAIVEAKLLRQARARKVIIFKYHSKTRHRRRKGHRQEFTELEIEKI